PGSHSLSIRPGRLALLWRRKSWYAKATARAIRRSYRNRSTLARNSSCSKHGAPGSLFSLTMVPVAGFDARVAPFYKAVSADAVAYRHTRLQVPAQAVTYSRVLLAWVRCSWGSPVRSYPPLPRPPLRFRL